MGERTDLEINFGNGKVFPILDAVVISPMSRFFTDERVRILKSEDLWTFPKDEETGEDVTTLPMRGWLVVLDSGEKIAFDLGFGTVENHPAKMTVRDRFLESLASVGCLPEEITHVVISHLHLDHTGWAVTNQKPTFPNAKYYMHDYEFSYYSSTPKRKASCRFNERIQPLFDLGILETVEGSEPFTLVEGSVTLHLVNGHTPGHMVMKYEGKDKKIGYFIGDAMHFPAQGTCPVCSSKFDHDEKLAEENRLRLVKMIYEDKAYVMSAHFAGEGMGEVCVQDGKFCVKNC